MAGESLAERWEGHQPCPHVFLRINRLSRPNSIRPTPTIRGIQYSGTRTTLTNTMHRPTKVTIAPAVISPLPDLSATVRHLLSTPGWSVPRRRPEQIQLGILRCDPPLEHHPARTRHREQMPFHAGSVASAVRGPWGRWSRIKSSRSARYPQLRSTAANL